MKVKDLIKKIVVFSLVVIMVTTGFSGQTVKAEEKGSGLECNYAEVEIGTVILRTPTRAEQKLVDTGDIQEINVTDLGEYIQNRKVGKVNITNEITDIPSVQTFGLSDVSQKTIGVNPIPIPPVWINCQFNYTTKKNNLGKYYFSTISGIKSWLTGIQIPISYTWKQKSSTKSLTNGGINAKIKVNGVISTHIIIQGIGKILDQNMSYSFDYTAKK